MIDVLGGFVRFKVEVERRKRKEIKRRKKGKEGRRVCVKGLGWE